jgi:hypothetical protein
MFQGCPRELGSAEGSRACPYGLGSVPCSTAHDLWPTPGVSVQGQKTEFLTGNAFVIVPDAQ